METVAVGRNRDDHMGFEVYLDDVNQDGWLDIIANGRQQELPGKNASGTLDIFYGGEDRVYNMETSLDVVIQGVNSGDHFGAAFGVLGDLDGNGAIEVVSFAARGDSAGLDAGDLYAVELGDENSGEPTFTPLTTAPPASHDFFGRSVSFVGDLNDDGVAGNGGGRHSTNACGTHPT